MTWRRLSAGVVMLAVACGQPESPRPAPQSPSSPPAPATATLAKDITVDLAVTANPMVILGHARTFENALTVRAIAHDKSVIAEEHVISTGEAGQMNPYRAELWLTRAPGPEVKVEAVAYSAKDGSVQASATRTVRTEMPATAIALVFPTNDCTTFETFHRDVPKPAAIARLMVEALVAGPTAEEKARGASPAFPSGSAVRSVLLRPNGTLIVDFNERLQNVGDSCAATAIRESVTRTLRQLPTIKKIVITAAGSEKLALQP